MKKDTMRFFRFSVILVPVFCVLVFGFLAVVMNKRSSETISEIGTNYMAGMSQEISMHFETTMELRLSQVEALIKTNLPGNAQGQILRDSLTYSAQVRGFAYLALYSAEGSFDMIYGDSVELMDPKPFLESLSRGEKKIAVGTDAGNERVILLGIPADYATEHGEPYIALVAGLPVSDVENELFLSEDDSIVYSHIIRRDGSFVIRSGDAYRGNYFERIKSDFEELDGKNADMYLEALKTAIEKEEDYSDIFLIGHERRHLYCTPLPFSEWYLVTVMPYNSLDESVKRLNMQWICMAIGSCVVILLILSLIFWRYFQLTKKQLNDLEEARLEAIYANEAKSEFLSNMSHDIRTPMNAIVGMTAIATANMDDQKQVQNCLRKITLSSRHLLGLINDVLDMSKIESGKMTLNMDQVSLREVMESIVSIAQPQIRAKNQRFDVSIHDIFAENVYCDSVRLNQVLINLLSNAVKFTPEEGTINVYLCQEASPLGDHYVRCHFRVRDSGIGMTPEFQKTIFDTFTREKTAQVNRTEGTGLGMAITKCIVDAMGGTIELWSEPGSGSEFHVILDFEKAVSKIEDMVLPPWRMLVVDNNKDLCLSAVSSLKEIGIDAEWATDGRTAVDLVEKRHQEARDYEIVLLDWRMPGMDGLQTAKEIRKILGDETPILIISAYDWSDIEKEAAKAGIQGFISKPLFKSNLFVGLRRYMLNEAADEEQESKKEETESFAGKRILLAEDNDLNWEIAEEILSEAGFELERAENGEICVEKFTESEEKYYDVILMDIRMPVMSGYDAAVEIRKLGRSDAGLPIIAMTADAFSEDIERCRQCGMNEHVSKPIDVDRLIQLLRKYLK